MNRLIENNYVSEVRYGTNFAYVLNDNSSFIPTEYKMLHGQMDSVFLKCMKMLFNGRTQLFYLTESYIPFNAVLPRIDADKFLMIVSNLFGSMIEAKNHGFLSCRHIDLSFDHIFVDPTTLKVRLVYIPAFIDLYADVSSFENEIRVALIKLISETPNIGSPKTVYLAADLQNGSIPLETIYSKLNGKIVDFSVSDKKERSSSSAPRHMAAKQFKLVAMDTQPGVEIVVDKPEFIIGKKKSAVDGVISFNKLISRIHCKIITRQQQYYIEDLMSANATYVNSVRLQPNVAVQIKNGDIVRMANSNFQVVIS